MEIEKNGFSFLLKQIGIHFGDALVEVDNRYIKKLYTEASLAQQAHTSTQGFLMAERQFLISKKISNHIC